MSDEDRFQLLFQSFIEGTATAHERRELAGLLRSSESALHAYVEQMRVHAMLGWLYGGVKIDLPVREPEAMSAGFPWKRRILSLAALLILSTIAAWWAFRPVSKVVFEVVATTGTPFLVGERVNNRFIELEHGRLSFRLESGAVVDVEGPAQLELLDPMHLRLLRGIVTADIGDGIKGFVVETSETKVVDLGTRFSVGADSQKGTDVAVFEGKVDVFDPSGKASPQRPKITLTEGEAIRISTSQHPDHLSMVQLRPNARSMEGGTGSDLVTDIRDNVIGRKFRGYYGLVRGGFGEGARAYTTGITRTWHSMEGESFPEELLGADGICTIDTDRNQVVLQITLQLSRACDVYVMADARIAPPPWLKKDFIDTGLKIRSGPWIPRQAPKDQYPEFYRNPTSYVPHAVWKRRVDAPGPLTLGTAFSGMPPSSRAMYGIAVKALP